MSASQRASRYARKKRYEIIKLFGGKCVRCGFTDMRALNIDHVHNDGYTEIRAFKSNYSYYKYVLENIDSGRYQLLCANCNQIKKFEHRSYTDEELHVMADA